MKIRCVAMDLDKTALALPESLGEENRAAIQRAAEKGILFVAASGRPLGALPEEIFHLPAVRYVSRLLYRPEHFCALFAVI